MISRRRNVAFTANHGMLLTLFPLKNPAVAVTDYQ
jgi:hypothetical protein